MSIGENIKKYRKLAKLTQIQLSAKANISRSYLGDLESDRYNPSVDTLMAISNALGIDISRLLNEDEKALVTSKKERDISKQLEKTLFDLENMQDSLLFDGEPLDEDTKELLIASLERTIRHSKQIAKEKFTPKKYK